MRSRIETARPGLTARAGAAKAAILAARLTAATIMAVALAATPLAAQTPPAAPGATSPAPTTTPAAPGSAPTAPAVRPSADAPSGSPAQTPAAAPAAAPSPAPNSAPAPAAAPAASPTKPAPAEPPLPVEKPAPATPTPPAPPAPAPAPQSSQPAPADAETSLVTLPGRPAAVLRVASAWPDGYPNILSAFARLAKALETEGLKPAGKPLAVLVETRDDGFTFEAMAPIAAAPAGKTDLTPDIKFGETPSGRAYKFQHRSAYDDLDTTYEAITAFLDDKGLEAKDQIIEEYLTTPREADDTGLQVDIYVMLKK